MQVRKMLIKRFLRVGRSSVPADDLVTLPWAFFFRRLKCPVLS
jgi:hypothetical protein